MENSKIRRSKKVWEKPTVKPLSISDTTSGSATAVNERFTGYPSGTPFGGS